MNELALFAGAGGGILGGKLLGWRTICAVEINPFARSVLLARQADGHIERFPVWDDIKTFDGSVWRGSVDVVSGGFPCQDISSCGKKEGLYGSRSGLWTEMVRVIGEVQPAYVFVENSSMLLVRGVDRVLWDLAALGYDARWGVVSAADAGYQYLRKRIWIVANANKNDDWSMGRCDATKQGNLVQKKRREDWAIRFLGRNGESAPPSWRCGRPGFDPRPIMRRKGDGVARWMDRINAIGNGQVPGVVRLAWDMITSLEESHGS